MNLTHKDLLELKRWNTPTIYNGWEQITKHDVARGCFNLEACRDFMPQMGPMVGYSVTVVIEPSNPKHVEANEKAWSEYRQYIAVKQGPKIVVVQDLDKPAVIGSFWGEVNSNIHHALGCVGTITDGAIRDMDEMTNAGFKAIARQLCVGHAHVVPVRWDCNVEVFGCKVKSGQLIHADKHGFLAIPEDDETRVRPSRWISWAEQTCNPIEVARGRPYSATGRNILKVVPLPTWLSTMMCALCWSMIR